MTATTMINFRIPVARAQVWQQTARRRGMTLSAFLRSCIDDACSRAEAEEQASAAWRVALPGKVRDLIGILPQESRASSGVDADLRADYHAHLEGKYA